MTAKKLVLRDLPTEFGSLHVSGATWLEAPSATSLKVQIDDHAELCGVVLDVLLHAAAAGALEPNEARLSLESTVLDLLAQHAPLYEVVAAIRKFSGEHAGCEVGISLLRFSQRDSRVEILNAGMPPVVWIAPDNEIGLHPALSDPIGQTPGAVHAYELCPLVWGSTWLAMTEAFARAQPGELFDTEAWLSEQGLFQDAHLLAREPRERLCQRMHSVQGPLPQESAALLCVHASSEPRF